MSNAEVRKNDSLKEQIKKGIETVSCKVCRKSLSRQESTHLQVLESHLNYANAILLHSAQERLSEAREWLIVCLEVMQHDNPKSKFSIPDLLGNTENANNLLCFLKELAARERGESEPREAFCVVRERR